MSAQGTGHRTARVQAETQHPRCKYRTSHSKRVGRQRSAPDFGSHSTSKLSTQNAPDALSQYRTSHSTRVGYFNTGHCIARTKTDAKNLQQSLWQYRTPRRTIPPYAYISTGHSVG
eukprot:3571353-Rhodomonas_salina.7